MTSAGYKTLGCCQEVLQGNPGSDTRGRGVSVMWGDDLGKDGKWNGY